MKHLNIARLETICNTELNIFQKHALNEWAKEFELSVKSELEHTYNQDYQDCLTLSVNHFIIAIAFVLHFGETTKFGKKRLGSVLTDIQETVELLGNKEYSVKNYINMLKDDGIDLKINF